MIEFQIGRRSSQLEIMDDLQLKGPELGHLLNDLARVNRYLGGNRTVTQGINGLLEGVVTKEPIVVVDLGCGDGELLRHLSRWFKKRGIPFKGMGIDANRHILELAENRSLDFQDITYRNLDIFDTTANWPQMDIAVCSLFLHHFGDEQIISILNKFCTQCRLGIVISDLERNRMALQLFRLVAPVFTRSSIARHDGQVSIARGFTRHELDQLALKIAGRHQISRKWAYRWQWNIQPQIT